MSYIAEKGKNIFWVIYTYQNVKFLTKVTNRMHVNSEFLCLTLQKKEKNIFWVIYVYLLVCEIRFFCTFLTKVTNRMHVNSGFLCLTLQEKKKKTYFVIYILISMQNSIN